MRPPPRSTARRRSDLPMPASPSAATYLAAFWRVHAERLARGVGGGHVTHAGEGEGELGEVVEPLLEGEEAMAAADHLRMEDERAHAVVHVRHHPPEVAGEVVEHLG